VALDRIVQDAKQHKANSVVGIRTNIRDFMGTHEMLMTGTASFNAKLPKLFDQNPATSDLTGEELWGMTRLGYVPVKLLLSTSIYSLGVVGGFKAMFQSVKKGEIDTLTTLMHEARDTAVDRLKSEAKQIGASKVVGTKTYVAELTNRLVEFMTIGTAIVKLKGIDTETPHLPSQAIIQDKDTWVGGYFGMNLDRN
jgi:uncharacterized protein YbjQ (UPF0145 family)